MVVKASKAKKKIVTVHLYRPLRNYIVFNYSEREAQNLEDDLQTLKQLRFDLKREPRRQRGHDLTAVVLDCLGPIHNSLNQSIQASPTQKRHFTMLQSLRI
ncbi:Vacuolar-sorting protein BRO1 [Camellia lanceoleosa]|uniref:Vacuolar-sorting protein BRO1 n=1 Tax=Camellia lanceoleosa TaxID=1840588 RepID=A0ACC0HEB4_9ERIC|nr:Vacuolar-sorting protein BRO1 [Camellia lanceoleosa]